MHGRFAEDHVPRVLQDAAARVVGQIGRQEPVPVAHVVGQRPGEDSGFGDGESGGRRRGEGWVSSGQGELERGKQGEGVFSY